MQVPDPAIFSPLAHPGLQWQAEGSFDTLPAVDIVLSLGLVITEPEKLCSNMPGLTTSLPSL